MNKLYLRITNRILILLFGKGPLISGVVLKTHLIEKEVHVSAFIIINAIVIGGALWGLSGMILFVPVFTVMKIIFESVNRLRPIALFMNNK